MAKMGHCISTPHVKVKNTQRVRLSLSIYLVCALKPCCHGVGEYSCWRQRDDEMITRVPLSLALLLFESWSVENFQDLGMSGSTALFRIHVCIMHRFKLS